VCVALGALLLALCLAACGGSSPSTNSTAGAGSGAGQPGGGRRGFRQDPKVVACLKKEGVAVPSRPRNGGAPGGQNGQPPSGQDGQPPSGQGAPNRRPRSAQFEKLRAALQKCGVTFQGRPRDGQPPQGGQGTTSTSAS
jgi:hypothetical protein